MKWAVLSLLWLYCNYCNFRLVTRYSPWLQVKLTSQWWNWKKSRRDHHFWLGRSPNVSRVLVMFYYSHRIHVWYIYLQNRLILFGQMLVNIPYMDPIWDYSAFLLANITRRSPFTTLSGGIVGTMGAPEGTDVEVKAWTRWCYKWCLVVHDGYEWYPLMWTPD